MKQLEIKHHRQAHTRHCVQEVRDMRALHSVVRSGAEEEDEAKGSKVRLVHPSC